MKITKDQLKGWAVCRDGYEWFLSRFPDGEAEYQDVLNALAKDDRPADAHWLMDHAGPDREAVLEVKVITDCKHFFAAGRLVIKTSATVAGWLRAGGSIKAGGRIKAGWGIKAGEGIKASGSIKAGWGIEADGSIKAGWGIEADWGIKASGSIEADGSIKAGEGIKAGEDIKAGEGLGIFAGLRLRLADWSIYARVIAKTKPHNLVSGSWVESAAEALAKAKTETANATHFPTGDNHALLI